MATIHMTDGQLVALARMLQHYGFSTGLPLDNLDPLANAAQAVMYRATDVIHADRTGRRQARPYQQCGADVARGITCTLLAGHDGQHRHTERA